MIYRRPASYLVVTLGGSRCLLLLVGGAVGADDAGLVAVELGDVDGGPVVDVPIAAVVVAGPHPPHPPLVAVAGRVVACRPRRREAAAHLLAGSGSWHALPGDLVRRARGRSSRS